MLADNSDTGKSRIPDKKQINVKMENSICKFGNRKYWKILIFFYD